jgi:ribosomal protein L37AE/L43A
MSHKLLCTHCWGGHVDYRRAALGYRTCMDCGEALAKTRKHTTAPINKSNYMLITNPETLKQLNPKRTT